jgi:hypothetical protein
MQHPYSVDAQAPPNDLCTGSLPITIGTRPVSVRYNTTYATTDLDVTNDCLDGNLNGNSPNDPGIWFNFTGTGRRVVARGCDYSFLSVFTGGCNPSALQCVAGTMNGCGRERFLFDTSAGTAYQVLVHIPYSQELVDVSIFEAPLGGNDLCVNAQPVVIGTSPVSVRYNTTYATTDVDVTNDCLGASLNGNPPSNPGIWFNFTGTGRRMVARGCTYSFISVFTGGCNPSTLQCVAGTTDGCGRERFFFNTTVGTTYQVLVQSPYSQELVDVSIFEAPPLVNDLCVNAQPVVIGTSPVSVRYNTTYATTDLAVTNDCLGANLNGNPPSYPGIWFNFTGTGRRMVARGCTYSFISVFTGGCNPSTLQCVAGTTDGCGRERFFFDTTVGTTYQVLIQSPYSQELVDVSFFEVSSGNDFCVNAQPVVIGTSPVSVRYNTTYATTDLAVTNDCLGANLNGNPPSYPGIWFNFTGTGRRMVARGCTYSFISVFTGGCNPSTLQCVAGTTDGCGRERFFFDTTVGTTYQVLVQSLYSQELVDVSIFEAPPRGNDVCTGALPFPLGSLVYVDPSLATTDEATIFTDCIDNSAPLYPGVWFNFTGTGEVFIASSCITVTYITIFTGICGRSTLQCVKATTNPCPYFTFNTTKDTVYSAFVQSYYDTTFDLTISSVAKNDLCKDAQPVTFGVPAAGNVTFALPDDTETLDSCENITPLYEPGVWYTFNGTGGRIAVDPCSGLPQFTRIFASVYEGGCGLENLVCVAVGRIDCGRNELVFDTAAGSTYHILINSPSRKSFEVLVFPVGGVAPNVPSSPILVPAKSPTRQPTKAPNLTPVAAPAPAGLCTISESGLCWKPNEVAALQRLVNTSVVDAAKFIAPNGTAVPELAVFVLEVRTFLARFYEGISIPQNLTDIAIIKSAMIPLDARRLTSLDHRLLLACNGAACAAALASLISGVFDVGFAKFGLSGPVGALGKVIGSRVATKLLSRPGFQQKILSRLQESDSTAGKAAGVLYESIATAGVSGIVNAIREDNLLSTNDFVGLAANVAGIFVGGWVGLGLKFIQFLTALNGVAETISSIGDSCPRPDGTCEKKRKITISIIRGDPHITSLDGLEFECQARGEFTLLKSLNTTFHIQGRFTKATSVGAGNSASVTSALAIREVGAPIVQISYGSGVANNVQECLSLVRLFEGGIARAVSSGTNSSGVSVTIVNQDEVFLLFSTGLEVHAVVKTSPSFGCFFSQWIALPENYRPDETLTGLLGNSNGNPFDDWQTKLGVTLPTPDNETALYQGSYDYCRTEWCIRSATESLFTYQSGTSFASYFECDVPYVSALEDAVAAASPEIRSICGTNVQCIIDGAVGSKMDAQSFVNDTIRIAKELEKRNITYNFSQTAPTSAPAASPTSAPVVPSCGIFGLSIFCPLKFRGFFGRLIRRILGLS